MSTDFQDASRYCKVAAEVFLVSTLWFAALFTASYYARLLPSPHPIPPNEPNPQPTLTLHITLMDVNLIFFTSIPLVSAILTYSRLAKPLEFRKKPPKALFIALTIIGYLVGFIAAGILLSLAYKKITS